ncbi:hypothetical protein BWQ96_00018 [Gracilariopsis chorda]|uniref:Uncharacterized protein n=1 Tax=Gracilariopsis chorda TaxID=448386 RepID=A0A2V3J605_9FLOR|nr:hypothetical protein BWQ96_00018 [Gracilariopsis chorda]|eukprot:PXF49858.1 hypothetical protein BWQ96_00018 [Gracilariopsis chorda]
MNSNYDSFTPRPTLQERLNARLYSLSSTDSTEGNVLDDPQLKSLAIFLEKFDPTAPHRDSKLRKPGATESIKVDEIDEQSVSPFELPQVNTRCRSIHSFGSRGLGRSRRRSLSRGVPISRTSTTNEEEHENSSMELARELCPESFHRFRRVSGAEARAPKKMAVRLPGIVEDVMDFGGYGIDGDIWDGDEGIEMGVKLD